MATLTTTARVNDIDPQAWLADVLARRYAGYKTRRGVAVAVEPETAIIASAA
jgi:hypothetical protein